MLWIFFAVLYLCNGAPVDEQGINVNAATIQFLKEKGYLKQFTSQVGALGTQKQLVDAVKDFQRYAGIAVTGKVDDTTIEWMAKPRCGRADKNDNDALKKRRRRYLAQGTSWNKLQVTWALENSNDDGITDNQVRDTMRKSFSKWQEVSNLKFLELVGEPINTAKIRVRFERGNHGDPYAFDGRGATLAHAFYPHSNEGLAGDVHFDDDEIYSIDMNADRNKRKLLWVAVHELGHSIGLEHSELKGAVMYPWYQHFEGGDFNLTYDDIAGLQSIYGSPVVASTIKPPATTTTTVKPGVTPVVTPQPTKAAKQCVSEMHAVLLGRDEQTYMFNNDQLFILHRMSANEVGVNTGPHLISDYFKTLGKVDAVFRRTRDQLIVFFHDDSFTVYDSTTLRHPARKISDGFQGLETGFSGVDATFVDSQTRKLYIFKGDEYWRFSQLSNLDYTLDAAYPQLISLMWKGLPSSLDAVFEWSNNQLYFFKGTEYYRWNKNLNQVHSGYPIKSTRSFLACSSSPAGLQANDDSRSSSATTITQHIAYHLLTLCSLTYFILSS